MPKKPPLYPHVPKGQRKTELPEEKPPLYREIGGKKHKLVGVEKSETTAEIWAANMREYSGEKIVVIPTKIGFALYREE